MIRYEVRGRCPNPNCQKKGTIHMREEVGALHFSCRACGASWDDGPLTDLEGPVIVGRIEEGDDRILLHRPTLALTENNRSIRRLYIERLRTVWEIWPVNRADSGTLWLQGILPFVSLHEDSIGLVLLNEGWTKPAEMRTYFRSVQGFTRQFIADTLRSLEDGQEGKPKPIFLDNFWAVRDSALRC